MTAFARVHARTRAFALVLRTAAMREQMLASMLKAAA